MAEPAVRRTWRSTCPASDAGNQVRPAFRDSMIPSCGGPPARRSGCPDARYRPGPTTVNAMSDVPRGGRLAHDLPGRVVDHGNAQPTGGEHRDQRAVAVVDDVPARRRARLWAKAATSCRSVAESTATTVSSARRAPRLTARADARTAVAQAAQPRGLMNTTIPGRPSGMDSFRPSMDRVDTCMPPPPPPGIDMPSMPPDAPTGTAA